MYIYIYIYIYAVAFISNALVWLTYNRLSSQFFKVKNHQTRRYQHSNLGQEGMHSIVLGTTSNSKVEKTLALYCNECLDGVDNLQHKYI